MSAFRAAFVSISLMLPTLSNAETDPSKPSLQETAFFAIIGLRDQQAWETIHPLSDWDIKTGRNPWAQKFIIRNKDRKFCSFDRLSYNPQTGYLTQPGSRRIKIYKITSKDFVQLQGYASNLSFGLPGDGVECRLTGTVSNPREDGCRDMTVTATGSELTVSQRHKAWAYMFNNYCDISERPF